MQILDDWRVGACMILAQPFEPSHERNDPGFTCEIGASEASLESASQGTHLRQPFGLLDGEFRALVHVR
jgi:hypothetical protein